MRSDRASADSLSTGASRSSVARLAAPGLGTAIVASRSPTAVAAHTRRGGSPPSAHASPRSAPAESRRAAARPACSGLVAASANTRNAPRRAISDACVTPAAFATSSPSQGPDGTASHAGS